VRLKMDVIINLYIYAIVAGISFFGGLGVGMFLTLWLFGGKEDNE